MRIIFKKGIDVKQLLLFLCLCASACLSAIGAEARRTVIVGNQAQFDALAATVTKNLKQGVTDLVIRLQQGVYYYGERHLDLRNLNYPEAHVTLVGHQAMLVAKHLPGHVPDWQDGWFDPRTQSDYDPWNELVQSPAEVDVVDVESRLCRIRTPRRQRVQGREECVGQYLQLTEWYDSRVYPVVRRDRRYIYFTATDLEYRAPYGHWNVNLDVAYGKMCPRYRTLSTAEVPSHLRCCQASTFVNLWHSRLGSFTLRGISFGPNNGKAPLLDTDMFQSQRLLVDSCHFSGIRGLVVRVWVTDNVVISHNRFEHCYAKGIESFNNSRRTQVLDNTFFDHGCGLTHSFGIICRGEDFVIRGNTFLNFCYSGIGVGMWYGNKPQNPITGIVADNTLTFDASYYDDYARHTLMDGGAIYTWTQCDRVLIRGNHIDHYRGMKDYRGIFCDDGTKNVTVQDNTVTNLAEGAWSIDLRRVDSVAGHVPDHNTGNDISRNIVDAPIRFE